MTFNEQIRSYLYQNKEYVDNRIEEGIELFRKGNAKISFVDKNGDPLKSVKVKATMKRHEFSFGANLFMLDEISNPEKNEKYKEYFKKLFNTATLPFYWCDIEPEKGKPRYEKDSPKVYRRPAPDLCVEWCKENLITPKAHCLNYDQYTPSWVEYKSVEAVKTALKKHFKELSERYAESIYPWEVTNETFFENNKTVFYEEDDYAEWSFKKAEEYFPKNELIINEAMYQSWETFAGNRTPYYMQIKALLDKGCRIDAIGIQYHMFWQRNDMALDRLKTAYDLKRFYKVLDKYDDFKKPMQITEITIPAYSLEEDDEKLQAEILTMLYKVWFSHKNIEAIIYWNLPDGYAAFAPEGSEDGENYYHGGLIRYDFTKKPAYEALDNLINEEWCTKIEEEVNGVLEFRGFFGEYEIEAEANGQKIKISFTLSKNNINNEITIEV